MQQTADVVIIGGGVIGCSTAYHLARQGITDVIVLEKGQIGSGASSKSAAMLSLQFCRDELTVKMARYAYDRYMSFEEELGTPIDFHKTGWMYVATASCADELRAQVALLQSLEVRTELLSPSAVKQRYPELNVADIVVGSWGPDDGHFDPHMIMSGYSRRARQMGVVIHEGVRALDVVRAGSRVTGVVTDQGSIDAGIVINAAGPWAAVVGQWADVEIPLRNAARSIVVTHPLPALPSSRPFVEDLEVEWYCRPELDGVLIGMGATPVDSPETQLDEAQVTALIERGVHRLPLLERASPLTAWTGVRPLTADGQAIVGPAPGTEGFVLNCGWGGIGVIMAPLAGQLVAELLAEGEMKTTTSSALDPARFANAASGEPGTETN